MIGFLRGKIANINPSMVVLDVHDVGYEVKISLQTFSKIKDAEDIFLYTYFMVREDAHTMYGFFEPNEKKLFSALISVNGVGANTALLILSSMSPNDIISTIQSGDDQRLTSVKGIGAKTAQRLVLELRDKVADLHDGDVNLMTTDANPHETMRSEAVEALVQLGISKSMSEKVVTKTLSADPGLNKIEDIIKISLQNI